jgi:UDP-N-acetyl-D-galactosamine dehydrogenase
MKIDNIKKRVAILGLGYVGLPLAAEFAKKNISITAFDIDKKRVKELKKGIDSNLDVDISKVCKKKNLIFTHQKNFLNNHDFFIISLPTPVTKNNKPDLRYLKQGSELVGRYLKKGNIVIYESTTYPSCTRNYCIPILEKISKLKINKDFYCGYSPERVNPGDSGHKLSKISKVVSGSNKYSLLEIKKLYKIIIDAKVYSAESIEIAEAAKIIENVQRDVNIALVNELSVFFRKVNIDPIKVFKAASTKWNFLNFKPGLVGGHCISVDPYYLTYFCKKNFFNPKIIDSGRWTNQNMSKFLYDRIISLIKNEQKKIKILILGFAFKENVSDFRNTKVYDLVKLLKNNKNLKVDIFDPLIDVKKVKEKYNLKLLSSLNYKKKYYDCIALLVPHKKILSSFYLNSVKILKNEGIIFDLKTVLKKKKNIFGV